MFEEIFTNQGFNHITENILLNLDFKSLWRCRLVCKGLHQFIKSLEKSMRLKKNDYKMIQRIRWKKNLVHPKWIAAFDSIRQEDNFYRRRGLIDLLETAKVKILRYSQGRNLEDLFVTSWGLEETFSLEKLSTPRNFQPQETFSPETVSARKLFQP